MSWYDDGRTLDSCCKGQVELIAWDEDEKETGKVKYFLRIKGGSQVPCATLAKAKALLQAFRENAE
jgi:hypothetical protein